MRALLVSVVAAAVAAAGLLAAPSAHAERAERHYREYAAVGDSITEGYGTSDWLHHQDGSWERLTYGFSYPEQAGIRGYGKGASCLSNDCGTGGLEEWLPTVLEAVDRPPTTLVVHLGVNDLILGIPAEQLVAHARQVRREFRGLGYRVVFATVVPPPRESVWAPIQAERLKFNDWVRTQATFVEYARPLQCDGGWLCPEYASDLQDVHVGNLGAKVMAEALRRWVEHDARGAPTG